MPYADAWMGSEEKAEREKGTVRSRASQRRRTERTG
jgi:hypothetical protein